MKTKICFVATIPDVVYAFLKGHVVEASNYHEVTVVSNMSGSQLLEGWRSRFVPLPVERDISPLKDIYSFFRLLSIFRKNRFDLVHSIMPKTGLLSMFAAWIARVPVRIHTFTGQVWATKHGLKRAMLKNFDRLIVHFATNVIVDSPSQRKFLVEQRIISKKEVTVIGNGSICGVDGARFRPNQAIRDQMRNAYLIQPSTRVLLFLGRLNRDKGVLDLARAFGRIVADGHDIALFFVGAEEDISFSALQEAAGPAVQKLMRVPFTPVPERYMVMADIFCLPSFREGFGQVILEAAACGIPSVASRIYGIVDAVEDGKSGLLFPAGDTVALESALRRLINDEELCRAMGDYARKRAINDFSADANTQSMMVLYSSLMDASRPISFKTKCMP